jgi:hypothetical protein
VDRRPARGQRARARQIAEEAERLRARHNCAHEHWTRDEGQAICEECTQTLLVYIMTCDQCRIQACYRCMRNRL